MNDNPNRARQIFQRAIEIADLRQRLEFIDAECRENIELRDQVNALIAAHDDATGILESKRDSAEDFILRPPAMPFTSPAPNTDKPGTVIGGKYKLLENIGEGGMGSVWVAEQAAPVKRRVAIKMIKAGMDSKQVLARFEAERQALALMDHPNIAKVFDGGVTDQGRPYFVME